MAIFDISRLIRYGYLPKELPPCFSMDDLASQATSILRATGCISPKSSIPLVYSGFKSEVSRRRFAVPNPYHYIKATKEIVDGEKEIESILKKSKYSLRAPIAGKPAEGESYAMKSNTAADTREAVEALYQSNQIEIRLDINTCFDSIYTHTIPWAIHGIKISKKFPKDKSLLGNRLDVSMQAMNYGQTNGVLVGNDLSRIVSEIILCTVDNQIQEKFPNIKCVRFVDDYYIYIKDTNDIQVIIAFIRKTLAKYQLTLNENKIQVNESPFIYGKTWLVGMQQAIMLKTSEFISWLINEYNKYKDPAILKYGLTVIDSKQHYSHKQWVSIQSRIINLWVRYPFLADRVFTILWNNKESLYKRSLKDAIYNVIDHSLLLGLDLELIWAVWFVKVFNIQISQECAIKILNSKNDLAIIILLDILRTNGLDYKPMIQKELKTMLDYLKEEDLDEDGKPGRIPWSSHWILAYEIERMNAFDSINESLDIINKDPFFMKLLRQNIRFYNQDFKYDECQVKNKKSKLRHSKRLIEYIQTDDFQNAVKNGDKDSASYFVELIEEALETY